jgi:esterase/lipase superfamily enzyme
LRGYTYDRESGEFSIYHVKQFLFALTQCPQVEHISILAHSRGTDVLLTALRELTIAIRAAGGDPMEELRLRNVVLAAPDLDLGITMQRVGAERLSVSAERFTVYTSSDDKAISLAEILFGGLVRLGQLDLLLMKKELPRNERRPVPGNVAFVQYAGGLGGAHGHSYFRENPAVSSDLVLVLRYDRDPGAEHGRPLRHIEANFWTIGDGYPGKGPPPR